MPQNALRIHSSQATSSSGESTDFASRYHSRNKGAGFYRFRLDFATHDDESHFRKVAR